MSSSTAAAPQGFDNHIAGRMHAAASGETFESFNPVTGALWGRFARSGAEDADRAVKAAQSAFDGPWAKLSPTRRGRLLMKWGELISAHAEEIARVETQQNGKLYAEMFAQAKAALEWLYYFGGLADKVEGAVIPLERPSVLNYTLPEPLGVVAVLTPWNSPTFLTVMSVAPALAAGNTVVIKPSEVTSASILRLAQLADEAGFPPGVVNVITGDRVAGEALVDHPGVAKVSFTGGDAAGRAIASRAGQRLVGCLLELGGKSPNIVFADANLDQAEAGVLAGIFAAAGQTCVAGSRAYVHRDVYGELKDRLTARAQKLVVGDPMLATTQMGPVATRAQLAKDQQMVERAVAEGAQLLCGGTRMRLPQHPDGFFFAPTILGVEGRDNYISHNEVFGPVLGLTPFDDEDEVVALANGTRFGLAAGVWTRDLARAHRMARRLQAGTVWINMYRALAFNSPFGGYKESGLGRQNGIESIRQYLQTKSVWCELSEEIQDPFVLKT
ncbi:MAG TPA: aldehyde dehydrogenase [Ramlibacter sp.]|uniref:aldehyde dehydrogenase n=1 Tax=Ramlibacter sp. TaxID=1917967 RepID=UPI002C6CD414|nr:aldehyde dehydrogenase [Ramlibacter sp.]HVZ42867.1 aldehyde dehydrogenase [Ramlibacter sp.]